TQVVLSGVVPFRIGKARADAAVQALPEIAGGFVNKHDLLSFEGYFLPGGLHNVNLRGTSAQSVRSRECSCIDCSILSPNEEKLLALNMVDFRPIDRQCAQNIINTDIQRIRSKSLDFTSDVVAVLHNDDVGFSPREDRKRRRNSGAQ